MKTKILFAALAFGLAAVACQPKAAEAENTNGEDAPVQELKASDFVPSKAEVDSVSYLLGINFGSFLKGYDFGEDLNFRQIVKGMKDFLGAEGDMNDSTFVKQFKINPAEHMESCLNAYLEKRQNYKSACNKEEGAEYLEKNAKKDGIVTTESGLQYSIVAPGNDVKPAIGDTVYVNYKGTLINGKVFDEREGEPVDFVLGDVIKGWNEGMQLIGEGGEINLYIPAELAYGENAPREIGPNSTLIFNVKLSKVAKKAAETEESK